MAGIMQIVAQNGKVFKNKKEIKEYIETGKRPLLRDHSLINPILGGNFFDIVRDFQTKEFPLRFTFVVPSPYERKYFGEIILQTPSGKVKVI